VNSYLPTLHQLQSLLTQAKLHSHLGQLPAYVPLLSVAQPHWCALSLHQVTGQVISAGDDHHIFPLMSIVKPFVVLFCLQQWGGDWLRQRVGMEPSDYSFAAIAQLKIDHGWPRNPMINSGALTLAGHLGEWWGTSVSDRFCHWLNQLTGAQLYLDTEMLASVTSLPNQHNRELVNLLWEWGRVNNKELTLNSYNQLCCLSGTVMDLVRLGLPLADPNGIIPSDQQHGINTILATCGLYQYSKQFAHEVGIPAKSGIGGGILAVVPGWGAMATYSPPLDANGTSVAGLFLIQQIGNLLNWRGLCSNS